MKHLSVLLSAALLCACQDKPAETPVDPKSPGSTAAASAGSDAAKAPQAAASTNALLAAKAALGVVPQQADLVAMTGNVGALIKDLGREQVIKAIPDLYARAATEVRTETTADLLDPSQWKTIGVDGDGPGGVFVITRSLTFGFVLTLSDAKAFALWLEGRMPGQALPIDGATVYLSKYGPTMLIKGEHLMVLGADRSALARAWGVALASLQPAESLAADPRIEAAAKGIGFGKHVGGFIDTQRTIDAIIGLEMRTANPDAIMLQAKAQALGQTEIAEGLNRFTRGRGGDIGEQMAIGAIKGMIAGGVGPMALGVEIEGAAVRLKADLEANPTALPRRVLDSRKGVSPMATLAGPKGVMLLDANLDLPQVMGVVNTVLMTGGGAEMARAEAQIRTEFNLDLKADIIPAFTGEAGGAMLFQDPDVKGEKSLGMTLFAGADPAKMQKVLDAVAAHPEASKAVVKKGERYTLMLPWRPVEVELKGTQLIVTTDATAFDRAPGRVAAGHLGASLSRLLATDATAATWAMELASIISFTMLSFSDWEMPVQAFEDPDADTKALIAQREELTGKIEVEREVARKANLTAINDMVGPLGHLALTASETDAGVRFEGGLFTRGAYLASIGEFAGQAKTIDARMREIRKPLRDLQDARRAIDEKMRGLRTPSMR